MKLVIEEKIPLKQGLKQVYAFPWVGKQGDWREDSIKTRIETYVMHSIKGLTSHWREDSIKTRIETILRVNRHYNYVNWREDSIKTRIETKCSLLQE